ncbi:peptidoglycan recognition protein family protein [Stenotrophomonas ginsengisoli]|uniref:peptidoglycan recognition protein family protein n=1 Tax=Stenotrophomonas ginsengisoli TaxID=336566 RepID=UPI0009F8998A|nr:N-acetylmuramoyl-L-alanine amidase [Stenotrophomonas ginsengisoli]
MSDPTQAALKQQIAAHLDGLALDEAHRPRIEQALENAVHGNPLVKRIDDITQVGQQIFAVYRPHGDLPPVYRASIHLEQVLTQPQPDPAVRDGWLTDPDIVRNEVAGLGRGRLNQVHAVVLHRTESATADSALRAFASGRDGVQYGTHFLVDKDGTIYQTASLEQRTLHVGKIKSRCVEEASCSPEEAALARQRGWSPTATYNHEKAKDYPQRYPLNEDSIGIEVVGRHLGGKWEAPTAAQQASINRLINTLQQHYGIGDRDVYAHDVISNKTAGEGAGLYTPAAEPEPERLQQPSSPSR